jgi:hypothetical protein
MRLRRAWGDKSKFIGCCVVLEKNHINLDTNKNQLKSLLITGNHKKRLRSFHFHFYEFNALTRNRSRVISIN